MLDYVFAQGLKRLVYYIVDCTEVITRFDNIVDRDSVTAVNGSCFKNQSCLVFRKFGAFDVVGVVCHPDLQFVVKSAGDFCFFFFTQNLQNVVVANESKQIAWTAM